MPEELLVEAKNARNDILEMLQKVSEFFLLDSDAQSCRSFLARSSVLGSIKGAYCEEKTNSRGHDESTRRRNGYHG